jgi:hypothetical protein
MSHTKAADILCGVVLAAIVALSFIIKPRPAQAERDWAAVEMAADRLTHQQIADAWTQMKLGNARPMQDIKRTFPFPPRTVYEDGAAIILIFVGYSQTCIDFRTQPDGSIVSARHR